MRVGARSGGGPDMQWVGRTVRRRGTCIQVEPWLLAEQTAKSHLPRKQHNTYIIIGVVVVVVMVETRETWKVGSMSRVYVNPPSA